MHYAIHMRLNHPAVIQWQDPEARVSIVSQSGHTLDKAGEGASFTLRFRTTEEERYIMVGWEVESDDATIYEEGTITIDCEKKGLMGKAIDYDGAFELPHQLIERLTALGYDTSEITA
ncbi:hypothetical protein UFOVP477_14 [uncultured Caudovirales phage]|uniref:Uncharacterized protein n=1 Tax=uncultured Caudovirales phage TaxID=2100421 RepID=A0A6J5NWF6_9CAUD|nr:hypothetical protein UFOVP477_14 [uncultured Caudovirales phage]CAB4163337.1 hypothetical protein UFOVP798_18 [uncultured Caudovirales phage]CAB4191556.1 hypothetical protein UFOVP1222_44 [uncultured Caudovirales phage]